MNAIEYALISDLAQREGGLRQMLDELVRAGALEAHYDMQGTKRYAVPKETPCEKIYKGLPVEAALSEGASL